MKKRSICLAASALLLVGTSTVARAQSSTFHQDQEMVGTQPIQLSPIKQLRKGIDAWPLIVAPRNVPSQRVNEILIGMNQQLTQDLRECNADYLRWLKIAGGPNQQSNDWSRRVRVTMAGPRFLSLVATETTFCGGVHPDNNQIALVFDLTTGGKVNWISLISKSAGASGDTDGRPIETLMFPRLQTTTIALATNHCRKVFGQQLRSKIASPLSFLLWPDAKREKLIALPVGLPHVVQACAAEISLTLDQARSLGFDESLLNAIHEAHQQLNR